MIKVAFSPLARKILRKLTPEARKRIIQKIEFYSRQENPMRFAERLIGTEIGDYRFRVGDYRIIFDFNDREIFILSLGHRREIYR